MSASFFARRTTHTPLNIPRCRRLLSTPASTVTPPPRPRRLIRYARRIAYVGLAGTGIYAYDKYFNASSITRSCRTIHTCAMITLDYKMNFTPEKSHLINELHERVADRMFYLFTANGGLYIKIGQAIGANAALLPKPVQAQFARLFDDAPQVAYPDILRVFQEEFNGRPPSGPGGVFEIFEEEAIASASIAQVHKAKLWPQSPDEEPQWVAVKIQKPDVKTQTKWDLGVYRAAMWMFENWAFDLPVYFVVDFVSSHLAEELDFTLEAQNAIRTAKFIRDEPNLSEKVYVPRVYEDLTTKRVMTAEWIEGTRMSNRDKVREILGSGSTLQGGLTSVMDTLVSLFSAQMFTSGHVHCDPHPGNIILRPMPSNPTLPQIVLLDHGLYVELEDRFMDQWANLWKGLLTGDFQQVQSISKEWGLGVPDLFASAVVMGRYQFRQATKSAAQRRKEAEAKANRKPLTQYEQSILMKKKLKEFLEDTDRMPKELIFILRNMRIIQGTNQSYASPVNRVKITGMWASRSLAFTHIPSNATFGDRLRRIYSYLIFRTVIFSIDVAFYASKARVALSGLFGGNTDRGFEDDIERQVREIAKGQFGVELSNEVFQG